MTVHVNYSAAAAVAILLHCSAIPCRAQWACDDWVARQGYCVDYVKSRIPSFPVPQSDADMGRLNNREVGNIAPGDVAVFDLGRYWHVAYVERVQRDRRGNAIAIDVSEKNFGPRMTAEQYRATWGGQRNGWERAVWCGVTGMYGRRGLRTDVPIGTVQQVWSPVPQRRYWRGGVGALMRGAHQFLVGLLGLTGGS